MLPKFKFLYYKNALDACLARFVSVRNGMFTRTAEGCYLFSQSLSRETMKKDMKALIEEELKRHIGSFDIENPEYLFIIGGCSPCDNMLLKYRTEGYFPEKLSKLVYSEKGFKYLMREKDILFDMQELNSVFDEIFDEMFSCQSCNIVAVRHSRLDCYSLFKILKWLFRGQQCVNIYKEKFKDCQQSLIAVNDLIDRYINCKTRMNNSQEFRQAIEEIRQYINERMKMQV